MVRHSASQRKFKSLAIGFVVATCCAVSPALAVPGDISKAFSINDDDPLASVPSDAERDKNPIEYAHFLQDMIARGERALAKKEYEKAAKYHEALAKMVPDRAISFSRLCVDYGRLGRPEQAAANCGKAIQLGGAKVIDHIRFVNFSLQKQEFTPEDASAVEASLTHLRAYAAANPQPLPGTKPEDIKPKQADEPVDEPRERSQEEAIREFAQRRQQRLMKEAEAKRTGEQAVKLNPMHLPTEIETLSCKLASRLRDAKRLVQCIHALRTYRATDAQLFPFDWARAILEKDSRRADALLEQGRKLGVPAETLAAMASEQKHAFGFPAHARWTLIGLTALLIAVAGIVSFRLVLRRQAPASPPPSPPVEA